MAAPNCSGTEKTAIQLLPELVELGNLAESMLSDAPRFQCPQVPRRRSNHHTRSSFASMACDLVDHQQKLIDTLDRASLTLSSGLIPWTKLASTLESELLRGKQPDLARSVREVVEGLREIVDPNIAQTLRISRAVEAMWFSKRDIWLQSDEVVSAVDAYLGQRLSPSLLRKWAHRKRIRSSKANNRVRYSLMDVLRILIG